KDQSNVRGAGLERALVDLFDPGGRGGPELEAGDLLLLVEDQADVEHRLGKLTGHVDDLVLVHGFDAGAELLLEGAVLADRLLPGFLQLVGRHALEHGRVEALRRLGELALVELLDKGPGQLLQRPWLGLRLFLGKGAGERQHQQRKGGQQVVTCKHGKTPQRGMRLSYHATAGIDKRKPVPTRTWARGGNRGIAKSLFLDTSHALPDNEVTCSRSAAFRPNMSLPEAEPHEVSSFLISGSSVSVGARR